MVMMLVLMVAAAALVFLVMVMVLVLMVAAAALAFLMMVMMLVLCLKLRQFCRQSCLTSHGMKQLRTGQIAPGRGYNGGLSVVLSQQFHSCIQLLLLNGIRTGQNDRGSSFDLVIIELTKVLAVNLDLACINHGNRIAQADLVVGNLVDCTDNVGQLAHTGRLNDHPVRMVLVDHLLQSLAEVTYQRAADAAGIHLRNVDTGILQKTAVNADLAEFILDENQLLACVGLLNHLFNQCGLTRTQEAAVNINFGHIRLFPSKS